MRGSREGGTSRGGGPREVERVSLLTKVVPDCLLDLLGAAQPARGRPAHHDVVLSDGRPEGVDGLGGGEGGSTQERCYRSVLWELYCRTKSSPVYDRVLHWGEHVPWRQPETCRLWPLLVHLLNIV